MKKAFSVSLKKSNVSFTLIGFSSGKKTRINDSSRAKMKNLRRAVLLKSRKTPWPKKSAVSLNAIYLVSGPLS